MNILTTPSIRAGYVMMLNLIGKSIRGWLGYDPFAPVVNHPPKNPHTAVSNDTLKEMAERIQNRIDERIAQHLVARAPSYQIGPAERVVTIPKDVWAELQAMPNDGSWSTRQLVRAIQRANKKKRGKA